MPLSDPFGLPVPSGQLPPESRLTALARLWRMEAGAAFTGFFIMMFLVSWGRGQGGPSLRSAAPAPAAAFEAVSSSLPDSPGPRPYDGFPVILARLEASSSLSSSSSSQEPVPPPPPPPRSDHRMGVYLTATSVRRADFFQSVLDELVEAGGDALIFDVKGSNVYFDTDASLAREIGTVMPLYDLPLILAAARERGIYTIGRFIAVKDPLFVSRVPAARVRNALTGKPLPLPWADPAAAETLRYNREILESLLRAGIDEVNFDYIRYSTEMRPADFGLTGEEKAGRLEQFLKMAKEARDAINPAARLGISTYPILGWSFAVNVEPLGQDFVRFAPLVDVISPMAYPHSFAAGAYYVPGKHPRSRSYYLVYRTLTGYAELLGPEQALKLRPWLQAYDLTPAQIRDEIAAVYDAGACGFTFWSARNLYDPTFAAMKGTAGERPDRCHASVRSR